MTSELTPYLCVADARAAIEWYVDVLGAEVVYEPIVMPDGKVGHVELAIDGARWMMADALSRDGRRAATGRSRVGGVPARHRARRRPAVRRGDRGRHDCSTAVPRTARRPGGWRCSGTRSGTAGSSTSRCRASRSPEFGSNSA